MFIRKGNLNTLQNRNTLEKDYSKSKFHKCHGNKQKWDDGSVIMKVLLWFAYLTDYSSSQSSLQKLSYSIMIFFQGIKCLIGIWKGQFFLQVQWCLLNKTFNIVLYNWYELNIYKKISYVTNCKPVL